MLNLILALAFAATPLPSAPPNGWCYDSFTTPNYNGVKECPNAPPPLDPGAYTNMVVRWLTTPPIDRMTDVTSCWNIWGRINPNFPPSGWPGANGATVGLTDNSTRYYRCHLGALPVNPGASHFLKAVSYGKSPPNLRAKFLVIASTVTGNPWPATGVADNTCYKSNKAFDDQAAVWLNPVVINATGQILSGVVNTSKCTIYVRQDNPSAITYDVLIDTIGNGVAAVSMN